MNRRNTIDSLRQELERLTIASRNIERAIQDLENQEQQQSPAPGEAPAAIVAPLDRDSNEIRIVNRVKFLTKEKYTSTEGFVSRFSRNTIRIFTVDDNGSEVPRSPRNVRVIHD